MMKPPFFRNLLLFLVLLVSGNVFAQPSNDLCGNAITLTSSTSCTTTSGTVVSATYTAGTGLPGCGSANRDVWYKFVAQSTNPTITVTATSGSTTRRRAQLFSGTCGTLNSISCTANSTADIVASGLTVGQTYYIRVYSSSSTLTFAFNICITDPAPTTIVAGRMNEVYQQTILSDANVLNYPWEVTYGPDNNLWVTEARGYKAYKIDPSTGAKTTILDIHNGSATSELTPAEHTAFNVQFSSSQNPWPQGGFAGLALHPQFLDGSTLHDYVYISYVYSFQSNTDPNGIFFTNRLVRFHYNSGSGKLETPVSLCDTLPGSSDHNSQRMIVAPVGGTYYLFYAQGDMGAGQFGNRLRTNNAQNINSYEGKILRFNLEPDGDAGAYDKWIPDDNPFNGTLGKQSAIWATGMRNNQGFAYDATTDILYGSAHGPYSDDEINIIQSGKNYGHPLVIGYAADQNYNGITAGNAPNMSGGSTSGCPVISNEVTAASTIGANYKDPLFSAYTTPTPVSPSNYTTMSQLWNNTSGANNIWPSEGWSGLDLYTNTVIPGWKRSLVAAGLKWGRLIRLKLGSTGTTTLPSNLSYGNTGDTVTYFQSTNRYRDLAFDPNGKDIYVIMDNSSATSGPGVGNPTTPACQGCLVKYTFLGYADAGGKSTIPTSIDVTAGTANTCNTGTTVTIDNTNNNLWVPITGPDGNIMAEIYANGNNLGTVTSSFYVNGGAIRVKGGNRYLDRNITITPQTQPSTPVQVRFYFSKAEFDALDNDANSGVNAITDVKILHNSDACGSAITAGTTLIAPAYAEAHGANGYMLQGTISSFSSFYFGSSNISLPLQLLTFTGSLQNDKAVLLKWKTANEIDVSYFEIERSSDGTAFNTIGSVNANGITSNNTTSDYLYTDKKAVDQQSLLLYYRLKMLDIDGKYTYSNIVTIQLNAVTDIMKASPNPTTGITDINFSSSVNEKAVWKIADNTGRVLLQNSVQLRTGNNNWSIDISKLAPGAYYLSISGSGIDQKIKLQKL